MQATIFALAALAPLAYAQSYTPPTDATFGALYTPDKTTVSRTPISENRTHH
jgi:hypothetical protein